jgi:Replication protein A OB domain
MVKYNFVELSSLGEREKDTLCDVIGVVKEVGQLSEITSKATQKVVSNLSAFLLPNLMKSLDSKARADYRR